MEAAEQNKLIAQHPILEDLKEAIGRLERFIGRLRNERK